MHSRATEEYLALLKGVPSTYQQKRAAYEAIVAAGMQG